MLGVFLFAFWISSYPIVLAFGFVRIRVLVLLSFFAITNLPIKHYEKYFILGSVRGILHFPAIHIAN